MSFVQDAAPELLALAAKARPEWDYDVLDGAVTAAQLAGWSFERILAEVYALIRREDGSPWDLKNAAAKPTVHGYAKPGANARGSAQARELLRAKLGADAVP
jgi:hypothetical protein